MPNPIRPASEFPGIRPQPGAGPRRAESLGATLARNPLYRRAQAAAAIAALLAPVLRKARFPVDAAEPGRVKVDEEGRILLLLDNAAQRSRLRNIAPRVIAALRAGGIGADLLLRIAPTAFRKPAPESPKTRRNRPFRPQAAASIREIAARTEDAELRAAFLRLADSLEGPGR